MPDLSNINISEFLPWLLSTAGLVFFATWLSKFMKKLRYPDPKEYEDYNPYMKSLADWIGDLTSLQMMNLSLAAYVVPVGIVYIVVNFVPADWLLAVQPHAAFIISVLLVYTGQQWVYKRPVQD